MKQRYHLAHAEIVTKELTELLVPYCYQIYVCGSIRRRKETVSDIELVYIPRQGHIRDGMLFEEAAATYFPIDQRLSSLQDSGVLMKRLSVSGSVSGWGAKNKYARHYPSGIPVDLFSTDRMNLGMALFVRTGDREWNVEAFSELRRQGKWGHAYGGVTQADGTVTNMENELMVFEELGIPWVAPPARTKAWWDRYRAEQ